MPNDTKTFDRAFTDLTGNPPFPWQQALYERFISDRWDNVPASCNLPTGLGKTSVIAIWLIALARHPNKMPRRLAYVVNRRTVVDQTTIEAEKLKANSAKAEVPEPVISTLRGQFADNREWSADPACPAIICGTVDMIGSRLLFSGYGVGFKGKPLHAGFLGQDVLLVHDEAHLEPAFQDLVKAVEAEQIRERGIDFGIPGLRVMELPATSRNSGEAFPSDEERRQNEADPTVKKRLYAKKAIHIHSLKDAKKLADQIADLAIAHEDSNRAVLVFVRTVEDVVKVRDKLDKESQQVITLTGTMRGKERDELAHHEAFQRFLPGAPDEHETVYLVCTSAGEVGVNISADHLVCDLSTFESMAQRFGRVNRIGLREDTRIDVVHPTEFEDNPYHQARKKTLALIQLLQGDGSSAALGRLDPRAREAAFAPPPTILPTSDILFDAWALTTIKDKMPGRPPVEPYLHGLPTDWQPPETHVAWREEVGVITGDLLEEYKPADLLEDFPVKPHELLHDNSSRVFDRLKKMTANPESPAWIVAEDGSVEVLTIARIGEGYKEDLYHKTVLLSPDAGGLSDQGMLDPTSDHASDVSAEWFADKGRTKRRRQRSWDVAALPSGMRRSRPVIDIKPEADEADEGNREKRFWYWYELVEDAGEGKPTASRPYDLQPHLDDAEKEAIRLADGLKLAAPLRKAIVVAAKYHDLGKDRALWQRSIGNPVPSKPLAKSGGVMQFRILNRYRHEYGSLRDVAEREEFKQLDEDMKELALHLIAAHHGRARPHFSTDEAFDPEPAGRDVDAAEIPRRFAKLQRKYGRWGLAYLESLVRAADIAASQQEEKRGGA